MLEKSSKSKKFCYIILNGFPLNNGEKKISEADHILKVTVFISNASIYLCLCGFIFLSECELIS